MKKNALSRDMGGKIAIGLFSASGCEVQHEELPFDRNDPLYISFHARKL